VIRDLNKIRENLEAGKNKINDLISNIQTNSHEELREKFIKEWPYDAPVDYKNKIFDWFEPYLQNRI